jgi:hypothetical protein
LEGQKREGIEKDFEGTEQTHQSWFLGFVIFGIQRAENRHSIVPKSILEGQKREGIQKYSEGTEQNTSHGFWVLSFLWAREQKHISRVLKSWGI